MKEKNKYFIFSDVHGEYKALKQSLEETGYDSNNRNHILVSCGDNFDRGPESRKVWEFLRCSRTIWVKGNHDAMFEEFLSKGMDGEFVLFNILHNGLGATIASFGGEKERNFTPAILDNISHRMRNAALHESIKAMPLYYETENFIFCHAGIDPREIDWKNTKEDFMLWDIEYSHRPVPNVNKIVVIGHHHAFRVRENAKNSGEREGDGWCSSGTNTHSCMINGKPIIVHTYGNTDENAPFFNNNKIAIDGCSNLTKKVNVIVVEDYEKSKEPPKEEEKTKEKITSAEGHLDPYWTTTYTSVDRGVTMTINPGYFTVDETTNHIHGYR